MNNYKVIDLFSGCGGSALGFKQADFYISVAVDNNKIACESFKLNFSDCNVINEKIEFLSGKDLLKAGKLKNGDDVVIIACPPCQGFSSARRVNQRLEDPRNQLVLELIRIIGEIKPIGFIIENVPGLAGSTGKLLLNKVLKEIESFGYKYKYNIVDAADYGVPQHRKRLVVIGLMGDKEPAFPIPTHHNPDMPNILLPPWKTVRNTISTLPPINAGETSINDPLHKSASLSERNMQRIKITEHDGGSRLTWPRQMWDKCHIDKKGHTDVYGRMKWDSPSPAITGGCTMYSKGRYGHPEQDRAISLREAAKLQTFTDDFRFAGNFGQISDQIGNAVPATLAKIIAETILNDISYIKRL